MTPLNYNVDADAFRLKNTSYKYHSRQIRPGPAFNKAEKVDYKGQQVNPAQQIPLSQSGKRES